MIRLLPVLLLCSCGSVPPAKFDKVPYFEVTLITIRF